MNTDLIEKIAEVDELLLEDFLTGNEIPLDALRAAIRRAVLSGSLVPVLCGSSLHNKGIQLLLDAVVDFLPAPTDLPPTAGIDIKTGAQIERAVSDSAPLSGLVFKIATDPYVGRLFFARIYSGQLRKGQNVYNPRTRKRERIMKLVRLHADAQEEVDVLKTGDIGAIVGLKESTTGDTLCLENQPIALERIVAPEPVMFMAVEPKARADRDKLDASMKQLAAEDPTCVVRTDAETGQTILSGMGELHLEILIDRLRRDFKVDVNVGRPMVSYYETVVSNGVETFLYDRELGGRRHCAQVTVEVAPRERGSGYVVEIIPAVRRKLPDETRVADLEHGLTDGILTGVLARYPMTDIVARVTDVAIADDEFATDVALRTAAVMGFREAAKAAAPELLEPIMSLEIATPPDYVGEIIGDINGRRGQICELTMRGDTQIVRAKVPLAELFGYSTAIRSLSRGRASYTMEPSEFAVVSRTVREQLLNR